MAQVKISDIMKERTVLSFEVYPPKTEKGMKALPDTIKHLCTYRPDFISCTYGAGGGNIRENRNVCRMIRDAGRTAVTHFTIIGADRAAIRREMDRYLEEGIDHLLAIRGDLPLGSSTTGGDFQYATDLVKFIKDTYGDRFEIAVAASPEGHIDCRSLEGDMAALKLKQDNGADYIITQLCWDMEQFKRWLDMKDRAGVRLPVDVGVMPVLDIRTTLNAALSRNGCVMERELSRLISKYWIFPNPFDTAPAYEDPLRMQKMEDFRKAGIEYTIRQMDKIRMLGINGIHLYAMNRWREISEIIEAAGLRTVL